MSLRNSLKIDNVRTIYRHCFRKIGIYRKDFWISKVSDDAPWVFSYYIARAFHNRRKALLGHQNQRESIIMVDIWNKLGYNVCVYNCDSDRPLLDIKNVAIVFGGSPLFEKACMKYRPKHKISYATGCYYNHQNSQVKKMTDYFNDKYHSKVPYIRQTKQSNQFEIADKILLIGSSYTISTFPQNLRHKITQIHQSTQDTKQIETITYAPDNEFFFMGSSGNMLRGIPLLIEVFTRHTDLKLHIAGPIDPGVMTTLKPYLTNNISFHGFLDLNGREFLELMEKCNFIIYPSGSEGCPGSVLNAMKNGLIPIVTPWAAFDGIEEYGYLMNSWDVNGVYEGVKWALSLSESDILKRKNICSEYVKSNYTIDIFAKEFESFFKNLN